MSFNFLTDTHKKVHFIGIGGISMSGLAAVLLNQGYKVSGSDSKESEILNKLKSKGAEIYIGHQEDNLNNVDLVVYTAAIPSDNPEIVKAKKENIDLMDRAEFLGEIMKGHKYAIAVAGTHGKTTTTSMLSHLTLKGNLDPTILVGGELDIINGNYKIGNSEYFLTEACEYKASFLKFCPSVGIILNIDADHLDYYKDINHIQKTFEEFSHIIPNDGYLIGCAEDNRVLEVLNQANCNTITYGITNGQITAKNIVFNALGCGTFDVYRDENFLFKMELKVPGKHTILNALASVCVGLIFELPYETIAEGITSFVGVHKRFEYKGEKENVIVVDDYAHHPVEIKATLNTAKNIKHNKIITVFQPHTYTRTKTLFDEFTTAFEDTDLLILMDIYAAREKDTGLVTSDELGDAIRKTGLNCINVHSHEEACEIAKKYAESGDLLLTVGAGDVVIVGDLFRK